ncbi:Na+/H+ antiporter [Jatrophihabitans endophyticus]|uniref:Na+/H+ antiporter n=1 Tax=Jatrophihabitans endophyticus TaxID=1206085 RepID=UPI0019FA7FD3|nr:Na+/H+ antiporter [Jatrophihabitans endophyticus]MBE7187540.1 Na+/H+ antiporter [Jatrophihabitans endophyticus]
MHPALDILALVAIVGFVAAIAGRFGWSEPLALVVVGVGLSFVPHFLEIRLTPDIVLIGLLPPLLYAAAIRTSLVDFRANRRAIALLSVGLVAFSTLAVGLVSWWVVPGAGIAAGLALGAVVAPPDAVAATTIARRVGMPRRIVAVLEGESLVNDGTALVALNTAIAAISASVTPLSVGWDIVRSAGGGVLVGLVAAFVLAKIRRMIVDSVLDTTLSFAAPYVAFLPAEEIHASGVLAVVVTGLVLGHKAPVLQSATSRIAENINWRTVQFVLENVVFLLIGLQLRRLVSSVGDTQLSWVRVVWVCAAVLVATILARIVWMFLVPGTMRLLHLPTWGWATSTVISWAGMRGVVTLAAAFLLPDSTPARALLALAAFVVVAGTLLIQGLTLPWLVRRLRLPAPDAAEDALQAAGLVTSAAQAGLAALDEVRDDDDPPEVIEALRHRATVRSNGVWEQLGRPQAELEPPSVAYRRLRVQMLSAERSSILEARDRGIYDDEVLRQSLQAIDLEESLLDRVEDAANTVAEHDLITSETRAGQCDHLRDAPKVMRATTPEGCEECLRDGTRWVHLRLCLTCGHVGCCDSSVGRHAEAHFHETQHPVMRSIEPGEAWRWCYVDDLLG